MKEEEYNKIVEDAKAYLNWKKQDFNVDTEYYTIVLLQYIEELEEKIEILTYTH